MARPRTIRTEKILETARQLFLEGGYGVSTADIARAAGVSEGSIFKRFGTKSGLFEAAMGLPEPDVEPLVRRLEGAEDVRAGLCEIAQSLLGFLRKQVPRVMMLWAQPTLNPLEALQDCRGAAATPRRILDAVADYLRGHMRAGRLRERADPSVPARMFIGALHSYVFFSVIQGVEPTAEEAEAFVQAVVETLWEGIRP